MPEFQGDAVMQRKSHFPVVLTPTVAKFVEGLARLLDCGTKQDERITLARSYTGMQDRYALLDSDDTATLVTALTGTSIFPEEQPPAGVHKMLRRYLKHVQQLVSWLQVRLVFQAQSQETFNEALMKLFVSPQICRLLCEMYQLLPDFSPLKQLPRCIRPLLCNEYNPVKACKELLRSLLDEYLNGKGPVNLSFRKSLNGLDDRSAKNPSTIRRELMELNSELSYCLNETKRKELIHKLSGVYTAMMALIRLYKLMKKWRSTSFQDFIDCLSEDMLAFTSGNVELHHQANSILLEQLYDSDEISYEINCPTTPENSLPFQLLLVSCDFFSSKKEPANLQVFLHNGLKEDSSIQELFKIQKQLKSFNKTAYYRGVNSFINGVQHLSNHDIKQAEKHFHDCLSASEVWPLGVIRNQAALFCLSLKLKQNSRLPPKAISPLLSVYIGSLAQDITPILHPKLAENVENLNLCELISRYNYLCSILIPEPDVLIINPLYKIEKYLEKIFIYLKSRGLEENEGNFKKVSLKLTGKRDRQRIKNDITDIQLYDWLMIKYMAEIETSLYFKHPKSFHVIPAICHFLELPDELRRAIAVGADPKRDL